jgi:hypothetical protein
VIFSFIVFDPFGSFGHGNGLKELRQQLPASDSLCLGHSGPHAVLGVPEQLQLELIALSWQHRQILL